MAVCALLAALVLPAAALASSTAIVGWGDNDRFDIGAGFRDTAGNANPQTAIDPSNVKSVLTAGATSYAVLPNETVKAWGGGTKGQLGDGVSGRNEGNPLASAREPVTVLEQNALSERQPLGHVKQLAASYGSITHALALVESSEGETEIFTWGASEYGERGNGEYGFASEEIAPHLPREVAIATVPLKHVIYVAAGGAQSFAITEEAGVRKVWGWGLWGWGLYKNGKLGVVPGTETHECRGEAGTLACVTKPAEIAIPTLPEGVKVKAIYAGKSADFALLTNGQVLAWGENEHGQLGNGLAPTSSTTPVYVCAVAATAPCASHLEGIKEIASGSLSVIALTEAGTVDGWGSNGEGTVGGTAAEECKASIKQCIKVPKKVEGLEKITQIAEGPATSVALAESGVVYTLGSNEHGQLGSGSLSGPETCGGSPCSRSPIAVSGLSEVGGVSFGVAETGEGHALAWLKSGSGPAAEFTLTPGHKSVTLHWTFEAEEFKVAYRTAPETGEEGTWITWEHGSKTCPCSTTITGLTAGEQYEIKVQSQVHPEGKLEVFDVHSGYSTPEP